MAKPVANSTDCALRPRRMAREATTTKMAADKKAMIFKA